MAEKKKPASPAARAKSGEGNPSISIRLSPEERASLDAEAAVRRTTAGAVLRLRAMAGTENVDSARLLETALALRASEKKIAEITDRIGAVEALANGWKVLDRRLVASADLMARFSKAVETLDAVADVRAAAAVLDAKNRQAEQLIVGLYEVSAKLQTSMAHFERGAAAERMGHAAERFERVGENASAVLERLAAQIAAISGETGDAQ